MSQPEPLIRSVSDTARWEAVFRARDSERPDALFRDPFARQLAGDHGEKIASQIRFGNRSQWSFVMRTYLFDQFVLGQIQEGVDLVINLGAGLDARPYRMPFPASLRWVEVDLPQILEYNETVLAREKPVCTLERICLDLAKAGARREFFTQASSKGSKALIITKGVLAYHGAEEVAELARDLAGPQSIQRWALDIASPGLLRMIQQKIPELTQAGTPLKFGPKEGPEFLVPFGWSPSKWLPYSNRRRAPNAYRGGCGCSRCCLCPMTRKDRVRGPVFAFSPNDNQPLGRPICNDSGWQQ